MIGTSGNVMINRLVGTKMVLHPYPSVDKVWETYHKAMDEYATKLRWCRILYKCNFPLMFVKD